MRLHNPDPSAWHLPAAVAAVTVAVVEAAVEAATGTGSA